VRSRSRYLIPQKVTAPDVRLDALKEASPLDTTLTLRNENHTYLGKLPPLVSRSDFRTKPFMSLAWIFGVG
jgi:hypothetical protein